MKLIDTRSSTCKIMRLVNGQYFINGNKPLMKRCWSFLESLSQWRWYKCEKWSTTGAVVNCKIQTSFGMLCRERDSNYYLNFWHFSNNDNANANQGRLSKLKPLLNLLSARFSSVYVPGSIVTVDETIIPWQGRLLFKQYSRGRKPRNMSKVVIAWYVHLEIFTTSRARTSTNTCTFTCTRGEYLYLYKYPKRLYSLAVY